METTEGGEALPPPSSAPEEGGSSSDPESESSEQLSDAEEEARHCEQLREKLLRTKEKHGLHHEKTASRALKLISTLIATYKLNETEALLDEVMPYCKEKGGQLYIKAIQSRAFCLFKQYRFKEALVFFHEQVCSGGCFNLVHNLMKFPVFFPSAKHTVEIMWPCVPWSRQWP